MNCVRIVKRKVFEKDDDYALADATIGVLVVEVVRDEAVMLESDSVVDDVRAQTGVDVLDAVGPRVVVPVQPVPEDAHAPEMYR